MRPRSYVRFGPIVSAAIRSNVTFRGVAVSRLHSQRAGGSAACVREAQCGDSADVVCVQPPLT
eukprot:852119-Pleurochrysis_carterae.AAC.1